MKKQLLTLLISLIGYTAYAQIPANTPKYIVSFKTFLEQNPDYFTDTLSFKLPNNGIIWTYYNPKAYTSQEIEEKLAPILQKATNFPGDDQRHYFLEPNFWESQLDYAATDISRRYTSHRTSYTLGFPIGLDYTGGKFTVDAGFRVMADLKRFSLGASLTNTVFFTDRSEGGVHVHHNPFINAEFEFRPYKRAVSGLQLGYLTSPSGPVFQGQTFQINYRYFVKSTIQLKVGAVLTDNAKTLIPTIGVRFF